MCPAVGRAALSFQVGDSERDASSRRELWSLFNLEDRFRIL